MFYRYINNFRHSLFTSVCIFRNYSWNHAFIIKVISCHDYYNMKCISDTKILNGRYSQWLSLYDGTTYFKVWLFSEMCLMFRILSFSTCRDLIMMDIDHCFMLVSMTKCSLWNGYSTRQKLIQMFTLRYSSIWNIHVTFFKINNPKAGFISGNSVQTTWL